MCPSQSDRESKLEAQASAFLEYISAGMHSLPLLNLPVS